MVVGPIPYNSPQGPQTHSPQYLAEHLARVFGTEEDPVNCSFYFKVGVCRNGDRCTKKHNHPSSSQTLLLSHLYPGSAEGMAIANEQPWDDAVYDRAQEHIEAFYEEVVLVLAEYGEIEEVVVVDNTIEYQLGNVYVRYKYEESAARALVGLTGRYYFGKLISAEYSPVADFREARCRAHHETRCARVGACRFMHIKHIPKAVKRRVARQMYAEHPEFLQKPRRSDARPRGEPRGERSMREIRDGTGAPPRALPPANEPLQLVEAPESRPPGRRRRRERAERDPYEDQAEIAEDRPRREFQEEDRPRRAFQEEDRPPREFQEERPHRRRFQERYDPEDTEFLEERPKGRQVRARLAPRDNYAEEPEPLEERPHGRQAKGIERDGYEDEAEVMEQPRRRRRRRRAEQVDENPPDENPSGRRRREIGAGWTRAEPPAQIEEPPPEEPPPEEPERGPSVDSEEL